MKITSKLKKIIGGVLVLLVCAGLYFFNPAMRSEESRTVEGIELNADEVDNIITEELAPLPSAHSEKKRTKLNRFGMYAWTGQFALLASVGGEYTTKGSFMEQNGVNLHLVRQDWLKDLTNGLLLWAEEFSKGNRYPRNQKAFTGFITMGDGAPYVISSVQKGLDEKFGKDKLHVQAVGAMGISDGEDKIIGPQEWKDDPESMRGSLISVVVGDGDWVLLCNAAGIYNIPINPDFNTYDENAINIYPSEDDDYINSAKELIKSQTSGFKVSLNVKKDGKVTSEKIEVPINGCGTWSPGDDLAFKSLASMGFVDVISTKEFRNQMPTTLFVIKEWAEQNPKTLTSILKSIYQAANQIKQYPEWEKFASEAAFRVFKAESPNYWRNIYNGYKMTGYPGVNIGGSRVFNLADAKQYYGLKGGVNNYEVVYNTVSKYVTDLNPMNFNSHVGKVVPYDEAVNLTWLKQVTGIEAGATQKYNYVSEATSVVAKGDFRIQFATGSATIQSFNDLETIYSALVQTEGTQVNLLGHTDNTGNDQVNLKLSKERAESVRTYLINKGIDGNRFKKVEGRGSYSPRSDNNTAAGRKENRRVEIILLN